MTASSTASSYEASAPQPVLLRWSLRLLVIACWLSGAIFGAYILAFFGGEAISGTAERWNDSLPALHDTATPLANLAIGAHFFTGGVLLLLGPVQFIGVIRRTVPALHRWLGRLYVLAAGLAGAGGLGFILAKGTIGGPVMNTGFGLYGALMILAAVQTYRHARARHIEQHRAWAIRLFALTVGSWLYRLDYGLWFLAAGRLGHDAHFGGAFDMVMAFFFYLPNLIIAEVAIRARNTPRGILAAGAAAVLLAAALLVLVATWTFTTDYWGPGIQTGLAALTL